MADWRKEVTTGPPAGCGLYIVVEAGAGADELLAAALAAVKPAAVLLAPGGGQRLGTGEARPLVEQARRAGVTVLILDDAALARAIGADGVHLAARDDPQPGYKAAREALGKDGVVGADAGISRHAAMLLAEAGANYVGFGAPPHLKDRDKARVRREDLVSWWAPIFEVPCVAFDVETCDEAVQLAGAGADFVAVTLSAGTSADAVRDLLGEVARGAGGGGTTP
jgi:thiamine-phosphate pyrophosphorylase